MDNCHDRLNFNVLKKGKIYQHSQQEYLKNSGIAKFDYEMLYKIRKI